MTEVEFVQVLERIGKELEEIKERLERIEAMQPQLYAMQREISWRLAVGQELKEPK